ncbi:Pyr_redox_2 domain-containing protein [Meloidogyne graminicola]|uniref:Pyr_redox_2 domain-containing protein n=1 Tax=Meloidogyne graminicola TaxID=189291 RepID=A0A8S9ZPG5_9BILA|nr:Pyr_redox_2 domain-containing protein [Meloidogyne graminicola]
MKFSALLAIEHFRLIVVGGGTGGCAVASKFSRLSHFKQKKQIAVIEPNIRHFYQPGFTLAAAGLINPIKLVKNENTLLPKMVEWINNSVETFSPAENIIATGMELRFDLIEGLPNGEKSVLEAPGICSIYFPDGAAKTLAEIRAFSRGQNAIFSFPNTPIKCGGAPQKFMFRERGVRNVEADRKIATFQKLDENGQVINGNDVEFKYNLLHIGAPCSPVSVLRNYAKQKENKLTDIQGFVKVNPKTLQSEEYKNIFAIASQLKVLTFNLRAQIEGKNSTISYDGYSSCPLLTDRKRVILAEFNTDGPSETFPFDQSKPRRISYLLKRYLMPPLYWHLLIRGYWLGPEKNKII